MYRPRSIERSANRRGAILIVVLALLALFAVIGLGFIFYADSEATVARQYKEAQTTDATTGAVPPDGQALDAVKNYFRFLVYDEFDIPKPSEDSGNDTTLLNSMRGQSLARAMYGFYYTTPTTGWQGANCLPYSGVGSFEDTSGITASGLTSRRKLVNFAYLNANVGSPGVYDPERVGGPRNAAGIAAAPTGTYIGKHAGYTFCDGNNFYLGAIDTQSGEVLMQSFHRPWIFGSLDPANPNWTNTKGRYLTLRPRPTDNNNLFPYVPQNSDGTYSGDVQNLVGGFPMKAGAGTGGNVGPGVQHNDSLWMDIGLKPFRWNGKLVKALVAPLIVDLDGRINLSAVGNQVNGVHTSFGGMGPWEINPAAATVAPELALLPSADAQQITQKRLGLAPVSQNGTNTKYFLPIPQGAAAAQPVPEYSRVNWNLASGTTFYPPASTSYPSAQYFSGTPAYSGYDNNQNPLTNHPSLVNPAEWISQNSSPRTYSVNDLRLLSSRYTDKYENYSKTDLSQYSGALKGPNPNNRNDAGNPLRMQYTTISTTLDVPMAGPGNYDYSASSVFQKGTATPVLTAPDTEHPYPGGKTPAVNTFAPSTTSPSANSDGLTVGSTAVWVNKLAALGGVDLNRPLTDYRTDLKTGLSPSNLKNSNGLQAWADRHNLARDIFARLVVATGAAATVDPATGNVTINAPASSVGNAVPQYEALRYLAQLAVNIVDYIDNDDVSTAFVWDPGTPMTGGNPRTILAITDPNSMAVSPFTDNFSSTANIQHVVFGTEKPRLVLNEAYSEAVNDQSDTFGDPSKMPATMPPPPTKPARVRFWFELLNPTSTPYQVGMGSPLGPLGDGGVNVLYEAADGATQSYNPYQILVFNSNGNKSANAAKSFRDPLNPRGDPRDPTTQAILTPDLRIDFKTGWTNLTNGGAKNTSKRVMPNGSVANPYSPAAGDTSILVLAPNIATQAPGTTPQSPGKIEWMPGTALGNGNVVEADYNALNPANVGQTVTTGLEYLPQATLPKEADLDGSQGSALQPTQPFFSPLVRHMVVLRRLANPYLMANDPDSNNNPGGAGFNAALPPNPYITVDSMDYVPTFDAIWKAIDTAGDDTTGRKPKDGNPMMPVTKGYDPLDAPASGSTDYQRAAVGRAEPCAAFVAEGSVPMKTDSYPTKFLIYQAYQTATNNTTNVRNTFGRHNGPIDLATAPTTPTTTTPGTFHVPFKWLIHFDRPLMNPLELLYVSARKPHELLPLYLQPGVSPTADNQRAYWYEPSVAGGSITTGLYRALDFLRVKPWDYGAPMGSKLHGRVNLNPVHDQQILYALLDAQGSNSFTSTDVSTITSSQSNTKPVTIPPVQVTLPSGGTINVSSPGQPFEDGGGNTANPYRSYGTPQYTDSSTSKSFGIADTMLRLDTTTNMPNTFLNQNGTTIVNPYQQAEAARKLWCNTTPVSNAFAVWVTVGFFDVQTDGSGNIQFEAGTNVGGLYGRPLLGKEVYKDVPGDLRQQYFGVVDRANLTLDPATPTNQGPRPFFTEITAEAKVGTTSITVPVAGVDGSGNPIVYADGKAMSITSGMILFLGNGPDPGPNPGTPAGNYNPLGIATNRERVTVSSFTVPSGGTTTLTISATTKYHPVGTVVTNAVLGNPGPQPNFDLNSPTYRAVVPDVTRIK